MKFVFISDSHGQHHQLNVPEGDVLIHAGDVSKRGTVSQVADFLLWFSKLPHTHKIFVAGNHDFFFEEASEQMIAEIIPEGVTYLNDSGCQVGDLQIWGSPIQPWFFDWAFNRQRGEEIKRHWDLIPQNTDILITHGPAYGILDKTVRGDLAGCQDLLKAIVRVQPLVHVSGHIHEGYGSQRENGTLYLNASVLDVQYNLVNPPICWESP